MQATGVLYQSVWDEICKIEWPSHATQLKAVAFVEFLFRKRHMENTEPLEYTDLAAVYFRQRFGTHYRSIIKPLLNHGILQSSLYYRPGYYRSINDEEDEYIKGQCLSYRINPELLDDDIIKVVYKGEKSRQRCRDEVTMRSKQILRQVRIPDLNSRELINFVKKSLTDARIRGMLRVNDEIHDSHVHIKGHIHPIAIEKVQRRTKDLIKDGKFCHLEHLDVYIKRKRRHLTQAYCDQLLRIKHRNVYADRNETNLRLDSNLTNLKNDFISLLSIDGQALSQVDLKNSQFRFFVYLLEQAEREILYVSPKTEKSFAKFNLPETANSDNFKIRKEGKEIQGKPVTLLLLKLEEFAVEKQGLMVSMSRDYVAFKKLVKTGQLYERIREIIWKETGREISRGDAKKIMFTISFSSYRYQPEEKQILKKYFPSIINIIDGFKKEMVALYAGSADRITLPCAPRAPKGGASLPQTRTIDLQPSGDECSAEADRSTAAAQARKAGNASFAVLLQQVESLIFIDEILAKCHRANIKALSKHDSIVCRQCDKHKVTRIICRVLNNVFGRYTYALDIDGDVFNLKPKKKSRIGRVATTLLHHLFSGVSGLANGPPPSTPLRDRSAVLRHRSTQALGMTSSATIMDQESSAFQASSFDKVKADSLEGDRLGRDSILGPSVVKKGDTAALIHKRVLKTPEEEEHRRALEEFLAKLRTRGGRR